MASKKLLLVNPGNDSLRIGISNDGSFPHLGVISLGTAVQRWLPGWEVHVFDGQVYPLSKIIQFIETEKPSVVGISLLSPSYQNGMKIATAAKSVGSTTIIGNDQANAMLNHLLSLPMVDYVCTADIGEFALVEFLRFIDGKVPFSQVPKVARKKDGRTQHNILPEVPTQFIQNPKYSLDAIPIPNRELLSKEHWKAYRKNYLKAFGRFHEKGVSGVTSMNRARGCSRFNRECLFCGILDLSIRFSSPEMFWKDVMSGIEQVDAEIFYETFDSMSSAPVWIKEVADIKPKGAKDAKFFAYAQALETTPFLIEQFKRMGVFRANMGLESGDDTMIRRLKGPRDSVAQNKKAVLMFKEAGILVHGSVVLGAPGETKKSLQNTIDFCKWLIDKETVSSLEATPLYPDFNAEAGQLLINPDLARASAKEHGYTIQNGNLLTQMKAKYSVSEIPNPDTISKDWASIFCEVSYEDILNAASEIHDYTHAHHLKGGAGYIKQIGKNHGE